jgi:pyruvyltransferase
MTVELKQFTKYPNAGDVASEVVVSRVTEHAVRVIGEGNASSPNLIAIGSILHWADEFSIVWGTGLIAQSQRLSRRPMLTLATRGQLTRRRLAELGIDSPTLVGDPGVLIAEIFPAIPPRIYKFGVVPHYFDLNEGFVARAAEAGAAIINPLSPLEDYLARLSSCELILSSSLHGLIFAHAYGIPAAWVKISDRVIGDGFKFLDYYSSIGVDRDKVLRLEPDETFSAMLDRCDLPRIALETEALKEALLASLA